MMEDSALNSSSNLTVDVASSPPAESSNLLTENSDSHDANLLLNLSNTNSPRDSLTSPIPPIIPALTAPIFDNPAFYLKFAIKDLKDKAKLCFTFSSYLDDLAVVEDVFGKNLVKVVSHSGIISKDEWPNDTAATLINLCLNTEKIGKQHIGFSHCLSQNVAKTLLDYGKEINKRIQESEIKVNVLIEDFSKEAKSYKKKCLRYEKLIVEADQAIRHRNSAIKEIAEKINDPLDEGFMNRSLTMVFMKSVPTDALKKQNEKCRQALIEVDRTEELLHELSNSLIVRRNELIHELREVLKDLHNLELHRIQFVKDSFLRFSQASSGMLEYVEQAVNNMTTQISSLDTLSDVSSFDTLFDNVSSMKEKPSEEVTTDPDSLIRQSSNESNPLNQSTEETVYPTECSTLKDVNTAPPKSLSEATQSVNEPISSSPHYLTLKNSFKRIDWFKSILEIFKVICVKSAMALAEIGDAEKLFGKGALKLFEKHGYARSTSTASSLMKTEQKCADIVAQHESPLLRLGWNAIIQSNERYAEAYLTSAEIVMDKACVIPDSIQRKIDSLRKELNDKIIAVNKKIENAKLTHSKISSKLSRVRKELRDRRGSRKGSVTVKEEFSENRDTEIVNETFTDENLEDAPSEDIPPSLEGKGVSTYQSLAGHTIGSMIGAVSAIGSVVRMESSVDRNNNRIAVLEDEERAYSEQLQSAKGAVDIIIEDSIVDVNNLLSNVKSSIVKDVDNVRSSYKMLSDANAMAFNLCQKAIERVVVEAQHIDTSRDIEYFLSQMKQGMQSEANIKSVGYFGIPEINRFASIPNELIQLERTYITQENAEATTTTVLDKKRGGSDELNEDPSESVHPTVDIYEDIDEERNSEILPPEEQTGESSLMLNESDNGGPTVQSSTHDQAIIRRRRQVNNHNTIAGPASAINTTPFIIPTLPQQASTVYVKDNKTTATITPVKAPLSESPQFSKRQDSQASIPALSLDNGEEQLGSPDSTGHLNERPLSPVINQQGQKQAFIGLAPKEETLAAPELVKFGLPATEKVLEYFSCALYPKRGLLTHGRMFITNHYVAFSGWPDTKLLISFKQIKSIEKTNALFVFPNALTITLLEGEDYFFGSFLDRDLCYRMLTNMVHIEKTLLQITNPDAPELQMSSDLSSSPPLRDLSDGADGGAISTHHHDVHGIELYDDMINPPDFTRLFKQNDVHVIYEEDVEYTVDAVWRSCWRSSNCYHNFLTSEGDFDIKITEWEASNSTCSEDVTKTHFQFKRTCDYLHPRTTMLFIGPKNAPTKQTQYLFLPGLKANVNNSMLSQLGAARYGMVFTSTQFEGIPLCDVFKVLQYWTFERHKDDNKCTIRVGCQIHYLKSTMMKSQILTGTKDELTIMSKRWVAFARENIAEESHHTITGRRISFQEDAEEKPSAAVRRKSGVMTSVETESTAGIAHPQVSTGLVGGLSLLDRILIVIILLLLLIQIFVVFYFVYKMNQSEKILLEVYEELKKRS